jgi:hypothetical protein
LVDDAVRVVGDRTAEFGPVAHSHHDSPRGQRAEVHTDHQSVCCWHVPSL